MNSFEAIRSKIGPRHELESLPNQPFNQFHIRQNFRVSRFEFFDIDIIRYIFTLKFYAVDIGETGQAKAKEGYQA